VSQLKKFAQEVQVEGKTKLTESSMERAKKEWDQACSTNSFDNLSKRTIRLLCGISSVVTDLRFQAILSKTKLNSKALRLLLPTVQSNWQSIPDRVGLLAHVREAVRSVERPKKIIANWQENEDKLLFDNSPMILGKAAARNFWTLQNIQEEYCLDSINSEFLMFAFQFAAKEVLDIVQNSDNLSPQLWLYLQNQFLTSPVIKSKVRDRMLGIIIQALEKKRAAKNDLSAAQSWIKDFCLSQKDLGDPRLNPSKWLEVGSEATASVVSWLSQEDIETFFHMFMDEDDHGRMSFWLQYVRQLRGSRVVICENDRLRHRYELQKLQEKKRTFSTVLKGDASAFILDFGDYIALEFSKKPNAVYVYPSEWFRLKFGSIYRPSFDSIPSMKDRAAAVIWQSHDAHQAWMYSLRNQLASLGIR
jgi:hypothetical protein